MAPEPVQMPRVPALDGLRGVLLLAVLVFHGGLDLLGGGFLAISSFATLAGFLLTTALLAEWSQSGRARLGPLWERRALRILPLGLLAVAAVLVLQTVLRIGGGPTYRVDVLSAVGHALNWRYALGDGGFTSIFTDPSPVQHLWAVGMVVQLLVLVPLAFVGLTFVVGRSWRLAGVAFAVLTVGAFAGAWLTAEQGGNDGLAYYGTHTRAGELLVGALFAFVILIPAVRRALGSPRGATVLRVGAPVALVGLLGLWHVASLHQTSLFQGVTAANALLTGWLVLTLMLPGPVTTVLASPPLRVLGTMSLAAYVIHWPVYLVIEPGRLDLPDPVLLAVRVTVSLVAAAAITWGFERPLQKVRLARLPLAATLLVASVAVAAVAFVLPEQPPQDVSLTIGNGREPGELDVVAPADGTDATTVALVGDGQATSLLPGFEAWNAGEAGAPARVHTHIADDCGLADSGPIQLAGRTVGEDTACVGWEPRLPKLLEVADPDVIVVVGGVGELGEREIDRAWRSVGDPVYDAWLADRLDRLAATLAEPGVPVLWATQPHVRLHPADGAGGDWTQLADNDPARVDRLNELIRRVVADRPGFTVVDLDAWLHELPRGEFGPENRVDGRDLSPDAATLMVERLMGEIGAVRGEPGDAGTGDANAGGNGDGNAGGDTGAGNDGDAGAGEDGG